MRFIVVQLLTNYYLLELGMLTCASVAPPALIEPDATPSALLEVHLKMTIIFPVVAAAPVLKVKANPIGFPFVSHQHS
jgi:hypothetical protein